MFGQQAHRKIGVAFRRDRRIVRHLVERAAARERPEPRVSDEREEQVALALIKRADAAAFRIVAQELGVGELNGAV
jgi:hypothetical protein